MKKMTRIFTMMALMLTFLFVTASAQELKKGYHESFDVTSDASVQLENKYGQLNVYTWDKNQVQIDVEVKVDAKNEKDSQKILDKINVKISGSNDLVKAITLFDGKLNCKNCEISIDYEVKVPSSSTLLLRKDFGNANVAGRDGVNDLKVEYGNLVTGELSGKDNKLVVKFGNAEIDALKAAELHLEYSGLELGKAGYLDLYSRFNGLEIGEVSELVLDSQYDGIKIASADVIKAKSSFSEFEVDEVFEKLEIVSSYGGVKVSRVAEGFSIVNITSEFGGVEIDISTSASYSLYARASFGDVVFPERKAEIKKKVEKDFSKEVEAFIGDDRNSFGKTSLEANIQLREVIEGDLNVFFKQQLDLTATYMAAFTRKDSTDWDAFNAHWKRIIKDEEIKLQNPLSDQKIVKIVQKEVKKRHDAILMFQKANRDKLVQAEEAKLKYLKSYMPKQMSEEEIKNYLVKLIDSHPEKEKDFAFLIKTAMTQLGEKAQGAIIAKTLKQLLEN